VAAAENGIKPGKDKAPDGAVVHKPEPTEPAHDIAVRKQRKLNDLARKYDKYGKRL